MSCAQMTATRSGASPVERHGRVEALDLLRLVAALSVVAYHYTFRGAAADGMTWLSVPFLSPVTRYGYLGVQFFFVISGFVIAYSAVGRSAAEFFVARASRIYPGFLICMTLTFLLTIAIGSPPFETSTAAWLANLTVVAPAFNQPFMDGVYWSIVYELIFYAWILAFIAAGLFPRRLNLIVAVWLALSLANETVLHIGPLGRLLVSTDSGFFAAGLMLYALYSGRRTAVTWLLLAAATAVGALQGMQRAERIGDHFAIALFDPVVVVICVSSVAVVALALLPRRLPLPPGLIIALGGLTYPLYLLHQHIGFMVFNRLEGVAPAPLLAAATAALVLATAFLVWRFVERPGQRLMKVWLPRLMRLPDWRRARWTWRVARPAATPAFAARFARVADRAATR
jgi:peptidoglycan/LPS O-acetylase OafA/YrhL